MRRKKLIAAKTGICGTITGRFKGIENTVFIDKEHVK